MKTYAYLSTQPLSVADVKTTATWEHLVPETAAGDAIFATGFLRQVGGSAKIVFQDNNYSKSSLSVASGGGIKMFGPAFQVSAGCTVDLLVTGPAKVEASFANVLLVTRFADAEISSARRSFTPSQVDFVTAEDPSASVVIAREYGAGGARYSGGMYMRDAGVPGCLVGFGGDFCTASQAIDIFEAAWPATARKWLSRWLVDQLAEGLADLTGGGKRP